MRYLKKKITTPQQFQDDIISSQTIKMGDMFNLAIVITTYDRRMIVTS